MQSLITVDGTSIHSVLLFTTLDEVDAVVYPSHQEGVTLIVGANHDRCK